MRFKPFDKFGHPIQQRVMTIVAKCGDEIHPLGTGFAINPNGLIMTASHVIIEAYERGIMVSDGSGQRRRDWELYALYITDNKRQNGTSFGGLLAIHRVFVPEDLDIAFAWIEMPISERGEPIPFGCFALSLEMPAVGDHILAMGYHKMAGSLHKDGAISLEQETASSVGAVKNIHPEKRDSGMLPFPCFETDARFDPGMSGGPVFNADGMICGVVCSGMSFEDGTYTSYASLLWPIAGCQIEVSVNGEEPKEYMLYDLAKMNLITLFGIERIEVTVHPNGKRTVSHWW